MTSINARKYTAEFANIQKHPRTLRTMRNKYYGGKFSNVDLNQSPKSKKTSLFKTLKKFYSELTGEEHVVNPELLKQKIPKSTTNAIMELENGGTLKFSDKGKFLMFEVTSDCITSATKRFYDDCKKLCDDAKKAKLNGEVKQNKEGILSKFGMNISDVGELRGVNDIIVVSSGKKPKVLNINSHFVCETPTASQLLYIPQEKGAKKKAKKLLTHILKQVKKTDNEV